MQLKRAILYMKNSKKFKKIIIVTVSVIVCAFLFLKLFNGDKAEKPQKIYRPVTVIKLREINPELELMLTGVVKSWKEEYFSFEVPGRVKWVIEKGMEVGNGQSDGGQETVIARIDPTRYQVKLKSLKARTESARAQAEALKVSIREVMLQKLEAIDANLKNAEQKFKRQKILF